jgi:hypothetical protein
MNQPARKLPILFCCFLTLFLVRNAPAQTPARLDFCDISKPDFFPVLPWDPYHGWSKPNLERGRYDGLESIADCNFNFAGFVLPRDLRQCRKLGLGALLLPTDPAFTNLQYLCDWKKLSDAEIDRRVRDDVRAAGSNPAVMGFFIMDEPGAPDFPGLAKAVAAVKKYAPGKLAYINLFPDYATLGAPDTSQLGTATYTEYLERFVREVHPQCLSYDNYMVEYSGDLKDRAKASSYYHNLLEVRRVAQEHHLPCLNIVSANQIQPQTTIPSPANLAFQAYTTLAAGYRGVTWYTYYSQGYPYAPIDGAGKKTPVWAALEEINRQVLALAPVMSRLESTGVFFTAPAPADNLPPLPGHLVESATCATPLMLGEFQGPNGQSYVMVVNLSLDSSAKFTLKTARAGTSIKIISSIDRSPTALDPNVGYWLPAGQGVLLLLAK